MATGNFFESTLINLHSITRNAAISYPKEMLIYQLRDFFSKDNYYHFTRDSWGFNLTPDATGLPADAGINDGLTTRIFIGSPYRQDITFFPQILVDDNGAESYKLSFNRESGSVQWGLRTISDGYGNLISFKVPESYIFGGMWKGSFSITINTRSTKILDELTDLVAIALEDILYESLEKAGVVVTKVSIASTSVKDDRNDHIWSKIITAQYIGSWRRNIPVRTVVQIISFDLVLARTDLPIDQVIVPKNLEIITENVLIDGILSL